MSEGDGCWCCCGENESSSELFDGDDAHEDDAGLEWWVFRSAVGLLWNRRVRVSKRGFPP
jgi:hypothetical protein